MAKEKRVTFRLTAEVLEALKLRATRSGQTLSREIVATLERSVRRELADAKED